MQEAVEFGAHPRSLQELQLGGASSNSSDEAQVLTVRTARDLQLAVSRGFPYIEILEHLDLTQLRPLAITATVGLSALLGSVPPEVESIRVRLHPSSVTLL